MCRHVQPWGCMQQHPTGATGLISRRMGTVAPSFSCWSDLWGCISGDPLQRLCRWAREPGQGTHLLAVQVQGKCKQWGSPVPQLLGSFHGSPTFFRWSLSRLLCRSCAIGPQLSLRRSCSKYRQTFHVLEGGKLSILLCRHLGPTTETSYFIAVLFRISAILNVKKLQEENTCSIFQIHSSITPVCSEQDEYFEIL